MDNVDFEKCKQENLYENFMKRSIACNGLKIEDYGEFMPKIFDIVLQKDHEDPVEMYESVIMDLRKTWSASAALPFHGPWHHGLVAGILIASMKNNGYGFDDNDVSEALKRGLMVAGGSCGFHGICGAGTGLGIALSIVNRSTPFHGKERSASLLASAEAMERIAKLGGPRCCKLSTYCTLDLGIIKLKKIGYRLPRSNLVGRCMDHNLNGQCHQEKCPYYPRH